MVESYESTYYVHIFGHPLGEVDHQRKALNGRRNLKFIGAYRGEEPMQVVSGSFHEPRIHFEAPPSHMMRKQMSRFIKWFNDSQKFSQKMVDFLIEKARFSTD